MTSFQRELLQFPAIHLPKIYHAGEPVFLPGHTNIRHFLGRPPRGGAKHGPMLLLNQEFLGKDHALHSISQPLHTRVHARRCLASEEVLNQWWRKERDQMQSWGNASFFVERKKCFYSIFMMARDFMSGWGK